MKPSGLSLLAFPLLQAACASFVPTITDDLAFPPALNPTQLAAGELADKGFVPASTYGREIPVSAIFATARPAHPLADTTTSLPGKSANGPLSTDKPEGKFDTGPVTVTTPLAGNDALSIAAAFSPGNFLRLKTSYIEKPLSGIEGRLALEDQTAGLNLRVDSSFINNKINLFGEWDYSTFDPLTSYKFAEDHQRMFRVGIEGREDQLSYGAQYGFAGNEYKTLFKEREKSKSGFKPGKQGTMFWARWGFGDLGIKASVSESWDNLENDPDKPRITDTRAGATLEYTFSAWPYVGYSLGYFQGTRKSSQEPIGYSHLEEPIQMLESNLDYASGSWNASLYSSYSWVAQKVGLSKTPSSTFTHYLSASFYPFQSFSITPALGYYVVDYSQFDAQTVNRSASLAFSHQLAHPNIHLTAFGSYDTETNQAWYLDRRSDYLDTAIVWSQDQSPTNRINLSFGAAYYRYTDGIYSDSNATGLALWLVFRLGSLPSQRLMPQFDFQSQPMF